MSRSVARCAYCHEYLIRHQPDGTAQVIVGNVARLIVDPTAHAGVNTLRVTCRCGREREWLVQAGKGISPIHAIEQENRQTSAA